MGDDIQPSTKALNEIRPPIVVSEQSRDEILKIAHQNYVNNANKMMIMSLDMAEKEEVEVCDEPINVRHFQHSSKILTR